MNRNWCYSDNTRGREKMVRRLGEFGSQILYIIYTIQERRL